MKINQYLIYHTFIIDLIDIFDIKLSMNIKSDNSVCIIGLGFVGLTLAVVMANKGFKVYGVEKNKSILNSLKKKQAHFYEPGLKENLKKIIKKKIFYFLIKFR